MVLREFYKQCEEFIEECKKYIWWLIILAVVLFGFFIIILQIAFTFFVSWVAVSACEYLGGSWVNCGTGLINISAVPRVTVGLLCFMVPRRFYVSEMFFPTESETAIFTV